MSRNVVLAVAALGLAAMGGSLVTRVATRVEAAPASEALNERLARLESSVPRLERSLARTGAQLGTVALTAVAKAEATSAGEDPAGEDGQAGSRAQARAEHERRHYDGLDNQARSGGGAPLVEQLRKNIAASLQLPKDVLARPLNVGAIDCSATVCRVEVRLADRGQITAAAQVLANGMDGLSMRPLAAGEPAVYYLGAPGHPLANP